MKICFILPFVLIITFAMNAQETKTPDYYFQKGEQALAKNEYITAQAHFTECLRLDNHYAEAYRLRAITREHLGEDAKALTDYNIYVDLKPKDPEGIFSRAVLRFDAAQYLPARHDFLSLLAFAGTAYSKKGEVFTDQNGTKDQVFNYLGMIDMKLKRIDVAIQWMDSAIRLAPSNVNYWISRGNARMSKKDTTQWKAAMKDFDQAVQQQPDYGQGYYSRAIAKERVGKFIEACADLKKAEQLGIKPDSKVKSHVCQ